MKNMKNESILNALIALVRTGLEEIAAASSGKLKQRLADKKSHTETAVADLKVGRTLVKEAHRLFGGISILVEETAPASVNLLDYDLVIDPIDCTRGFLFNLPGTGCAAAYLRNGEPIFSAIGQLMATNAKDTFLQDIVCGGFVKNRWQTWTVTGRKQTLCRTSPRTAPEDFMVSVEMDAFDTAKENFTDGFRIAEKLMPPQGAARAIRMFGSSSLNFVALGRGSLDVTTGSRKPWDYLPGIPIIQGAGGKMFFYKDSLGNVRLCAAANEESLAYAKERHIAALMTLTDAPENMLNIAPSV